MARFNVLDIKPVLCQRIGIIPTSIITPPHKFFRTFTDYYVWVVLFTFLVSSLWFVLTNFEDINASLKTIPMIIGGFQSLGMFMGVGFRAGKITILREKLQTLVDNGTFNVKNIVDNRIRVMNCFFCPIQPMKILMYFKTTGSANKIVAHSPNDLVAMSMLNKRFICQLF